MRLRKALFLSLGIKCAVLLFILCLVRTHIVVHAFDNILFDFNSSLPEMRSALARGVNVDMRNEEGMTPLMIAARRGDLERARFLVRSGADINARSLTWNNMTPLQFAVLYGANLNSMAIAKFLIDSGADVQVQDSNGDTVLHNSLQIITAYKQRMDMVSFLIKHGALVNAQNKKGNTMLHDAVEIRDQDWIELFRKDFFLLIDENVKNNKGFTAYEYALDFLFTDLARKFNEKPAIVGMRATEPIDTFSAVGLTPLMYAVLAHNKDLVQELINVRGARVNLRSQDNLQYPPLQLAMLQQNVPMVELLLKSNADISVQNASGQNSMEFIEWVTNSSDRKKILNLFMQTGANINMQGRDGNTLLHRVVMRNDLEFGNYMIKTYGKLINAGIKNNDYNTPLNLANQANNRPMIDLINRLNRSSK
ncbi:MAG TPA: ankyrin repeat domain-containing protein [Candidatus Dependentiae bacterium]|nr:ankyrin repeat domain-containing protein [Candidatus Dependentiae bacterium]HRQ62493.1 ankyrin repeat domain-containing protein [Candidatus Dependentiae bacterium]